MSDEPQEGSSLAGWLAPTQSSPIDQVDLADIEEGWAPGRVDALPLSAAVAVIRSVGIVDPVLLRPATGGRFELVAGHRVVAAAREAGMNRIPAVVRAMDDGAALMALALDGTASGRVSAADADELRRRMAAAGVDAEDVDDVMAAVPIAVEPEPVAAEPEPVAAEPEPVAVEPEPVAVGAIAGAEQAESRWVPLPAGRPRLARLSSAFADAPRMLRLLTADGFTGTVELAGSDGRRDSVTFLEGACIATTVEEGDRRTGASLRLPAPDRGPTVEITVRPHPAPVVIALALALRAPARLVGLHAAFLDLPGLLESLSRRGSDAAVVVSSPRGAGVVLISGGEPIAAYARREGEEPGESAETTDFAAVADLLAGGEGEVDVHDGPLVAPLNLEEVIAAATA